mgnify:CR=1 FL=1
MSIELLLSIQKCFESAKDLRTPGLILIYATIDIMGSLERPEGRDQSSKEDFRAWADKYVIGNARLECTSLDLYAARCAIVHTFTANTKLVRSGRAVRILYSWGQKGTRYHNWRMELGGIPSFMIHVDTFYAGLALGVGAFREDVARDERLAKMVYRRADNLIVNVPIEINGERITG